MANVKRHAVVLACALALSPVLAHAQTEAPKAAETAPSAPANPPPPTGTQAEVLFQEGKSLLEAGQLQEACAKLAQSDALDPAIGTLGLLATCHEQQGRTATAWREYRETAARAKAANDEREAFATARAEALLPKLPRLVVHVPAARAKDAVVLRNGLRLAPEELDGSAPIDPGTYDIVVRFPDKPELRVTATLESGKTAEVEVPDPDRVVKPPPPEKPVAKPVVPQLNGGSDTSSRGFGSRRVPALVAGSVGLVGFGVAGIFAASAASKNSASVSLEQSCNTQDACNRGRALRDEAFSAAMVSNIAFGVGIAGAATALVLVLLPETKSPSAPPSTARVDIVPWVAKDSGGAHLLGHF